MQPAKRILNIVFLIVGGFALLAGIGTVTLVAILFDSPNLPGANQRALLGSLLYFAIAGVCGYAVIRMRREIGLERFSSVSSRARSGEDLP